MQTWEFRSKSNPSLVHKVQGHEDGTLSCSCNGWRNKKADKPRECTHTRQVIAGGFKPVIAAPAPVVDEDGFPEPMSASALTVNILQGELTRQEFKRQFPPDAWVGEDKIDGQRILLRVQNHVVTKWGASNVTLPLDLVDHLCRLRDGLYDGELAIPGMTSTDVPNLELRDKLTVYLFDML
jgi:hypothetical protein